MSAQDLSESEMVSFALTIWANYIETHNVVMSARDAVSSKQQKLIVALGDAQMKLVLRLRALAKNPKLKIIDTFTL